MAWNGVGVSISRCRNFYKNTINFTEFNKSLKKTPWFSKIRLRHIWNAVHIGLNIWHHFLFCENVVLLPNYIVFKIENIPPIGKFSKIKNKKTAITFGEEYSIASDLLGDSNINVILYTGYFGTQTMQ